jgi:hypothetical protein
MNFYAYVGDAAVSFSELFSKWTPAAHRRVAGPLNAFEERGATVFAF